jgi:hypothetical protein
MPEAKRVSKTLTAADVEQLKESGHIGAVELKTVRDFAVRKIGKVEFVLSTTDGKIHLGDLKTDSGEDIFIEPRSLVYLPYYVNPERIAKSVSLRVAIINNQLQVVEDPTTITEDQLKQKPSLIDSLPAGEHLDESDNPFDIKAEEFEDLETQMNERLTARRKRIRRAKKA